MFKKVTSLVISLSLIIPMFANFDMVFASEGTPFNSAQDNSDIVDSEVLDNGLVINTVSETSDAVLLETHHSSGDTDIDVQIEMDVETESFAVNGEVESGDGTKTSQNFDVVVHESDDETFIATFIDTETGEIVDIDTTELQASALPLVIVAAVARFGINYAIKKYGKKAAQAAVKSKSYNTVLSSVSKLGANKRSHILASKHDWHKVTNNNWTDVSKVISHVMRHGKESAYGSARKKTLSMNGQTVTVTFQRVNGEIKISNAWVNK